MAINVQVSKAIKVGRDFELQVSIDDGKPGKFDVTISVDDDDGRKFGMKRGSLTLPPASSQQIDVAGAANWTITELALKQDDSEVTVTLTETAPPNRTASDSGGVV